MAEIPMKSPGRDASFTSPTVEIIAARAGYRCSYPGCDESTIGPGAGNADVERKGTAAHIFAASAGGPRGTGGLLADDRKKPQNGVWLCADHGRIVDADKGKNYPATTLQSWKALQEQRISRELQKVLAPAEGWLQTITFGANPLFGIGQKIVFGKVTLIIGSNGTGKSTICEWLSGCGGSPEDFFRWSGTSSKARDVSLVLRLLIPQKVVCEVRFKGHKLHCDRDGVSVADLSSLLRVLYVQDGTEGPDEEDDVEFLARVWRIHLYQVEEIVVKLSSAKYGFIRATEWRPESPDDDETPNLEVSEERERRRKGRGPMRLFVQIGTHDFFVTFRHLSGRERSQVILAGAMILANQLAKQQATLLVIDLASTFLPGELLSFYAEKFADPEFRFQTLLVHHSDRKDVNWTGWSFVRLTGRPPGVTIEQNTLG